MNGSDELRIRHEAKKRIRAQLRALRMQIPASARSLRSSQICEKLSRTLSNDRALNVATYLPILGEVELDAFHSCAFECGVELCVPSEATRQHMEFKQLKPDSAFRRNALGFPEPLEDVWVSADKVNLIVLPCLAVDERGYRLGYGGGFYDQVLVQMPSACRVAVAFDFQLVMELPQTPNDVAVHSVVTDRRVHHVASTQGGDC